MRLQESAMDNLNKLATDILECRKCESERLEMIDAKHDEDSDSTTFVWECKDCGHVSTSVT